MKSVFLVALLAVSSVCFPQPSTQPLPRKTWLGVAMAPAEKGVKVAQVVPGGTGEVSGLKVDDVVLTVDGVAVTAPAVLAAAVNKLPTGGKAKVEILRGGQSQTIELTARPRPVDKGPGYETIYDEVKSGNDRIRVLVTKPTAPSTRPGGKYPAMFLIQGIGYVSNEQPLTSAGGYGRICKAFNDKGYVTVRVEKPGLGDSDGGPADKVDFDREVDAFRQALIKTKTYDFVDAHNIVIFGHSMGGCQGPILASEIPVKGLAVYGTVIRTWHEYLVDMMRSQAALGGTPASSLDESARNTVAALHLIFNEGLSPAEAKGKYPKWAAAVDSFFPDGEHFSGVGITFWRGCFAQNYAAFWEKLNANVLSIWGESDFVCEQIDHPMIADVVNKKNPGKGRYVALPNSDHGFRNIATLKESRATWGQGGKEFNPAICDLLTSWADEITKK